MEREIPVLRRAIPRAPAVTCVIAEHREGTESRQAKIS